MNIVTMIVRTLYDVVITLVLVTRSDEHSDDDSKNVV